MLVLQRNLLGVSVYKVVNSRFQKFKASHSGFIIRKPSIENYFIIAITDGT